MMMRRFVPVLAGVALLPLLTAGACDERPAAPAPSKAPAAGAARPAPATPATAANQPGPQDDPGACNQRGRREIELQAHWLSDKRYPPKVMWLHNGKSTPATNLKSHQITGGQWEGEWSTLVTAGCHDTLAVRMEQAEGQTFGMCAIIDLGQGPVKTGKSCRAEYKVP